jgi:membrane fusion protein, multidrug efflux system
MVRCLIFAGILGSVVGCNHSAASSAANDEPPVVAVSQPLLSPVTDTAEYNGRTDAVESVEVRARVSGYLIKMNDAFKQGKNPEGLNKQEVKKDEILFEIDDRPYKAALEKAQADIKLAQARYVQADADVKRNEPLVKSGATPKADFDKMVADRDVATAQTDAFKAAADAQKLNVEFCTVRAPVDGRVSKSNITLGNLVSADQTLLTTIVSQDPMWINFDVDERTMLAIQQKIREGSFKAARSSSDVHVNIGLANEPGRFPHEATVDFVDNRVDAGTGTLHVRAVIPNPIVANGDRVFSPGMFVRVQLPLGEPRQALLVSERAFGTDQGQKYLFVVRKTDNKNVVEYRPVSVGSLQKGGLRVVMPIKLFRDKDGLRLAKPDEMDKAEDSITKTDWVVVNGLQRVRPGLDVKTNEIPMPTQLPLLEAKETKSAKGG